jgi:hypothetical protein
MDPTQRPQTMEQFEQWLHGVLERKESSTIEENIKKKGSVHGSNDITVLDNNGKKFHYGI